MNASGRACQGCNLNRRWSQGTAGSGCIVQPPPALPHTRPGHAAPGISPLGDHTGTTRRARDSPALPANLHRKPALPPPTSKPRHLRRRRYRSLHHSRAQGQAVRWRRRPVNLAWRNLPTRALHSHTPACACKFPSPAAVPRAKPPAATHLAACAASCSSRAIAPGFHRFRPLQRTLCLPCTLPVPPLL
jgi:hypothetical protein